MEEWWMPARTPHPLRWMQAAAGLRDFIVFKAEPLFGSFVHCCSFAVSWLIIQRSARLFLLACAVFGIIDRANRWELVWDLEQRRWEQDRTWSFTSPGTVLVLLLCAARKELHAG